MNENEMLKNQKSEAILRMELLHLDTKIIEDFKQGKIFITKNSKVAELIGEELKMVLDWQRKTKNLVYYVIKNETVYGVLYSFLYVSNYEIEWEEDRQFLKSGYPCVYVKNITEDRHSEYGSICIGRQDSVLVRIS